MVIIMSEMLNQLKAIINSDNPPPAEQQRIKYLKMKQRSEELTTAQIVKRDFPKGQSAYEVYSS